MAGLEWHDVEKKVGEEIASLQEQLEAPLPIDATNHLRGKLAALRWVLRLPETAAPADPDTFVQPQRNEYD